MKEKMRIKLLAGKPVENTPLGILRCRWVDNIKLNVGERMGWCGLDWSRLGPVEGSCEWGNEPSSSIKCWEI
jgi:hypothetical protein